MNPIRRIRRIAGALAFVCLVLAVAAPAAFARTLPPFGVSGAVSTPAPPPPVQVHTVIVSGMAGWQIALIAVGAALVAATIAVLLDRVRTARLKPLTEGA
jgi:Na+/proline symporter